MKKPTILYVDDDLSSLSGREALLKMSNFDVLVTTSGRQGLALFTSLPVDAVILDYEMPEMNGDVIAAKMKEFKPEVPIMLLSAHDTLPKYALEKVDVFISKGEPPMIFVAAVNELVRCGDFFFRWLRGWEHQAAA
jgi:response regulator RpfG family c-di-GMP phosphodiesterase